VLHQLDEHFADVAGGGGARSVSVYYGAAVKKRKLK
jgi:hypothetical protein